MSYGDVPDENGNVQFIPGDRYGSYHDAIYMISLNKQTGDCEWAKKIDQKWMIMNDTAPAVIGNKVIIGVSSLQEEGAGDADFPCCDVIGKAVALDVNTGDILWEALTVDPDGDPTTTSDDLYDDTDYDGDGEPDHINLLEGYSGNTIWGSPFAIDDRNNSVYFSTGNAYTVGNLIGPTDPRITPFHLAINSIVALDLNTGEKKWVYSAIPGDYWNTACVPFFGGDDDFCPEDDGPDYDFGSGALLMQDIDLGDGTLVDIVTAQSKSGEQYAVNALTGDLLWFTRTGPGTIMGLNGQSFDGQRLYVTTSNAFGFYKYCLVYDMTTGECLQYYEYTLPDGTVTDLIPEQRDWELVNAPYEEDKIAYGGIVSALDPATGDIIWQNVGNAGFIPASFGGTMAAAMNISSPTVANGVVYSTYAGPNIFLGLDLICRTFDVDPDPNDEIPPECLEYWPPMGTFVAMDASDGSVLLDYSFAPTMGVNIPAASSPLVLDGKVYVGAVFGGLFGFSL